MKIIEVICKDCNASFETLESIPKEVTICPSCGNKNLSFKTTEREFSGGCSGNCARCSEEH